MDNEELGEMIIVFILYIPSIFLLLALLARIVNNNVGKDAPFEKKVTELKELSMYPLIFIPIANTCLSLILLIQIIYRWIKKKVIEIWGKILHAIF